MAEETAQPIEANQPQDTVAEDMDLVAESAVNGSKRTREDDVKEKEEEGDDLSKKQKVDDRSVEEERLEKIDGEEIESEDKGEDVSVPVTLGPKSFESSVEMFDYFFKLLHYWPPNLNLNKYEHLVLLDLLNKGHSEKIGVGIQAFQVRYHPMWKSRCFFLIRNDDTMDDFSFRKCVDKILPLPEDMKLKGDGKGKGYGGRGGGGGGGRGGGRGRGRGRGRGGKPRN